MTKKQEMNSQSGYVQEDRPGGSLADLHDPEGVGGLGGVEDGVVGPHVHAKFEVGDVGVGRDVVVVVGQEGGLEELHHGLAVPVEGHPGNDGVMVIMVLLLLLLLQLHGLLLGGHLLLLLQHVEGPGPLGGGLLDEPLADGDKLGGLVEGGAPGEL